MGMRVAFHVAKPSVRRKRLSETETQIMLNIGVCVLVQGDTAGRVGGEHGTDPHRDSLGSDHLLNPGGDIEESFCLRLYIECCIHTSNLSSFASL